MNKHATSICSTSKWGILFALSLLISIKAVAFSAYENNLLSASKQRIGLVAFTEGKHVEKLKQLAEFANSEQKKLARNGVHNLSIYFREINNQTMVFAYFESPDKTINGWGERLSNSLKELGIFAEYLQPHPRAVKNTPWLRMEWMNIVASTEVFPYSKKTKVKKMGLISGLKPSLELQYRQLHQSNWPGVVDGMVNSNYRNWTSFMVELGQKLYLFTYTEYIGKDIAQDNKAMAADPSTQRWWQHTEQCLINLHGEGNWSLMSPLAEPK